MGDLMTQRVTFCSNVLQVITSMLGLPKIRDHKLKILKYIDIPWPNKWVEDFCKKG